VSTCYALEKRLIILRGTFKAYRLEASPASPNVLVNQQGERNI
jgi:hypothetical protein